MCVRVCVSLFMRDTQELSALWAFMGMQLVPTYVVFGFADPNLLASSCSAILIHARVVAMMYANDLELYPAAVSSLLLFVKCHSLLVLLGGLFPKCAPFAITTTGRRCTYFNVSTLGSWHLICFLRNFICCPGFAKHPQPKNTTPPITTEPK